MQATTQYFVERLFYKQGLDYHRPSKILCQTSGRQNHWSLLRRQGKLTAHKSTYLPHNPDEGKIYMRRISFVDCLLYTTHILFMGPCLLHIFEHKLYIVRHVTGNDQDYLRKIPRAVVQISALL